MNFSEPFIRRPVMTVLVMAGILIFGLAAHRLLPVSTLPNVDFPTILVTAEVPGASPETMASAVATVLERQFSTISGIDEMSSVSGQGATRITLQFSLDRDIDAAAQDVNSAIAAAARQLPASMPAPPSFRKLNPSDFPVYYLALTSDTLPLSEVDEYAETYLAQRISTVTGVAQVQVYGQSKYAVRVQVDPNALAARGIGINEVEQALSTANVNLPTGTLYGKDRMFAVQATGQLADAPDLAPDLVHTGSIATVLEPGASVVLATIEALRATATVSYDPNVRPQLMGSRESARKRIEEFVEHADVVKASDEDLAWLFPGTAPADVARRWLRLGPALVVVTLGPGGAYAAARGGAVQIPAPPTTVVDTIGAGDSFMAGLLAALSDARLLGRQHADRLRALDVDQLRELLEFAAGCAAVTVSRPGADPPRRDRIMAP